MQPNTLKGVCYMLFAVLVWAGWMVASRFAVKGTLTAYDITALRFSVGGLLLLPTAIKRGLRIGPWGLKSSLLLAALMGAPFTNIAVAGMMFAPASHASAMINGTVLVCASIVGIIKLREPTSRLRVTGIVLSAAGILCLLTATNAASEPYQWLGHLFFILSGVMWSVYILLLRLWKADALHAATVVVVLSMIVYMPFYLAFAHSHITLANWHAVAFQAFYQGVLVAVVAFIAFNASVTLLGASRASAFVPLVPVLATLLAIPILGEIPSALEWGGVAAVSFGVLLASGVLHWRPRFLLQRLKA